MEEREQKIKKLEPTFTLIPEDGLREDLSTLRKHTPYAPSVPMDGNTAATWQSDERSHAFKWWLAGARLDKTESTIEHRHNDRAIVFTREPNPLLHADSAIPLQTVEQKQHLDQIAKLQLMSKDKPVRCVPKRDLKLLGRVAVVLASLVLVSWLITK
jgi:hypothetical protein